MPVFNPGALSAPLQTIADALHLHNSAPAALIAVSDGTHAARAAGGLSSLESGTPAEAGQSFEIGSQTKMMVATVLLQMAEEGLVDLDAPIGSYLPGEMLAGIANATETTLRQALSMRSGIVNYTDLETEDGVEVIEQIVLDNPDVVVGPDVALELVRGLPALFEPGTAYAYSNTGYTLLGRVIEAVSAAPLGQVLEARIFAPLGMEDSFLNDFRDDPLRLSSYAATDDGPLDVTGILQDKFAEGGAISTTADMITFMNALLVDQSLLSPEALAQMVDFQPAEEGMAFGLGLMAMDHPELGLLVGFAGGTAGTDTASYLQVDTGRIVSTAVTMADLEAGAVISAMASLALVADTPAWSPEGADDVLDVQGLSAAELLVDDLGDAFTLSADDAQMLVEADLRDLDSENFAFADGSLLLLGSDQNDRLRVRNATGALDEDNQLLGLDGHDSLVGGRGDDRVVGGAGNDRMVGRAGADTFVFGDSTENGVREHDRIRDYQSGLDVIELGGAEILSVREMRGGVSILFDGDGDALLVSGVTSFDDITFV